jgi:hypothetical protein
VSSENPKLYNVTVSLIDHDLTRTYIYALFNMSCPEGVKSQQSSKGEECERKAEGKRLCMYILAVR